MYLLESFKKSAVLAILCSGMALAPMQALAQLGAPNGGSCASDDDCASGNCNLNPPDPYTCQSSSSGPTGGGSQNVPEMELMLIPGFILAAAAITRRSRKKAAMNKKTDDI